MKHLFVALAFFAIGTSTVIPQVGTSSQAKWKQIILMRSQREDVEKQIGPSKYRGYSAMYSLNDGSLDVEYYAFNFCEPGHDADWNLPQWTVIEMTYDPDDPPQFASLKLDLRKFRKVRKSPHVPEMVSYVNDAEGVEYTLAVDGTTVQTIRYFPGKRLSKLRCSDRSNQSQ